MSISKIVITGQVVRNPEKRFTENNLAITSFTLNFAQDEQEKLIRVSAFGNSAEKISQTIKKGHYVVVEGGLQTNTVKTDSGTDKKFFEINAQNVEILSQSGKSEDNIEEKEDVFGLSDEISNEDLIGEDEIPF
ncbi:MAG TPA: single-stranded DNA-binding protein [Candidatus Gastranaerophilales bacterium]|nr:single-stranded DNA-binding protein [Candidatus Gastranaerophilales bacterium]